MALSEAELHPFPEEELSDRPSDRPNPTGRPTNILDPGFDLTLRPMRYPNFYNMYQDAIKNTWTVD